MPLNQGGRLEAKVTSINESAKEFTVAVSGNGHEHHGKSFVLPFSMWNGPGGVLGEKGGPVYKADDPRATPSAGASVIFDADIYAKAAAAKA